MLDALRSGRRTAGRAESAADAFELARRVGAAVGTELCTELRRAWNGFADGDGGIYVQVVVGRRQRYRSKYVFRLNRPMRKRLDGARAGWLALALAGWDSYLLFPWKEARSLTGEAEEHRHQVYVAVDAAGRVEDMSLLDRQRWLA